MWGGDGDGGDAWDATGNRLESSLPMFCYLMGYVVENAGRRKLVRPRLHGRDWGAVATVCTLLRQPVGASGYRTREFGFQAPSCLTNGHHGLQVVSMCVCVSWEGEDVHRCHVGERTQGCRERCIKTCKEKNILFCINSVLHESLLIWGAVWILR